MIVCDKCGSIKDLIPVEIYLLKDKGYKVHFDGCEIMQYTDYQPELSCIDLCPECLRKMAETNADFLNK